MEYILWNFLNIYDYPLILVGFPPGVLAGVLGGLPTTTNMYQNYNIYRTLLLNIINEKYNITSIYNNKFYNTNNLLWVYKIIYTFK